jgi:hypothetical protein
MKTFLRTRWGKALAVVIVVVAAMIVLPRVFAPQSPFTAQCRRDVALYNRDVHMAANATSGAAQYVDLTAAQAILPQEKHDCT